MFNAIKTKISTNLQDKHFSEIFSGSIFSFITKVLTVGIGLIINLVIAKYYGADVLGAVALVLSLLSIATMISLFGTDVSILRFIPPLLKKGEQGKVFHIVRKSMTMIGVLSLGASLLIFLFAPVLAQDIFGKTELMPLIALAAFFVSFRVLGNFSLSAIRALKNIRLYLTLQFLPAIINLTLLGGLTYFFYARYNPVYSLLASQTFVALLSVWYLHRFVKKHPRHSPGGKGSYREIFSVSYPMFLTASIQMVVLQTDTLILSSMSSMENVGVYSVVTKLALLSSFVITSINTIVAPKFSELYYTEDIDALRKIAKKSSKLIFFSTLPISMMLVVFGTELLSMFGDVFTAGTLALIMLTIGQLVNAMAGSVGYLLNMTGHQKTLNKIVMLGGVCNVVLNLLLIPSYGINGAAFASMFSMVLWNLIASYYVNRQFGFYIGYIPLVSRNDR